MSNSSGESSTVDKTAVQREVLPRLDARSHGPLEFEICNISAALHDLGLDSLDGYKPRGNYQRNVLP